MRLSELKAKDPKAYKLLSKIKRRGTDARTGTLSQSARVTFRRTARKLGVLSVRKAKAIKLTVAEKKAKGTHQACRDTTRSLVEVRAELSDALDGIVIMRANLTMAAAGIKEKGMYILSRAANNKGEVVTTEKLNPAFKVQREAMSALKSLKRAVVLLREEEQLGAPVRQSG